jgi:hypothetical protein
MHELLGALVEGLEFVVPDSWRGLAVISALFALLLIGWAVIWPK